MHIENVARRIFIVTIILGLAGCAGPVHIGDPGRPLMAPGDGLVAASVAFTTSSPDFMHYRGFLYNFNYEPTDGSKNELHFGLNDRDPRHFVQTPRAPNETAPVLFLYSAKPGKYRLKRIQVSGEGWFNFWPKDSKEIEVVAGQVTYLGSTVFRYSTSYRGIGVLTPTSVLPGTRNDFDRDMADLKAVEKRLDSVTATNSLTR